MKESQLSYLYPVYLLWNVFGVYVHPLFVSLTHSCKSLNRKLVGKGERHSSIHTTPFVSLPLTSKLLTSLVHHF